MRPISMERVENTRQEILNIITSRKLTHEQKLTNLAGQADSLLEVLIFRRTRRASGAG
ncbi:MAG: hypothetical protein ACLRZ6_00945 [Lachnospiraceae bacterium]